MGGFQHWLAGREEQRLGPSEHSEDSTLPRDVKKQADDYADSFTNPVTLARTRKNMEAEAETMRTILGIKKGRRRGRLGR
jgi:hypothetical protein